jgi:hypothetical protein
MPLLLTRLQVKTTSYKLLPFLYYLFICLFIYLFTLLYDKTNSIEILSGPVLLVQVVVMGAQQSSESSNAGGPAPVAKTCYYELLSVERSATDDE